MKGQVSFLTRPVLLIMTVVILIILLQTIWSQPAREKKQEIMMDLMTKATKILDILVSSEDCLALRTDVTKGAYAYVISKKKLEEFAAKYPDIEPPCARDYQYGYRVTVETLLPPMEKWEFGAAEFSKSLSLRGFEKRSIPVGIMINKKDVRVGRITIEIYDGTLERISGFIDESCMLGRLGTRTRSRSFHADALISFRTDKVCLDYGAGTACKPVLCGVQGKELAVGDYILTAEYKDGKVVIST
jgi:hypothetical protein